MTGCMMAALRLLRMTQPDPKPPVNPQAYYRQSGRSSEPATNCCPGRPNALLRVGHDGSRHVDVAAKPGPTLLTCATIDHAQIA